MKRSIAIFNSKESTVLLPMFSSFFKLLGIICLCLTPLVSQAQQDPMYSQYMFNGLAFNPAYAGSRDAISLNALARMQWVGFSGAPTTQSFSFHLPTYNRRHGFGFSAINDQISYLGQTWLNADYAYRIPMGKVKLAFGLRATVDIFRIAWEDADFKDRTDQVAINYPSQTFLPNAGFGMYLYSNSAYLGLSVPRLLVNNFDSVVPEISLDGNGIRGLRRHYFATAGLVLRASETLKFKPSVLFKYVGGVPFQFDFNLNTYFKDRIGLGVSYRTGDAIVGLLDLYINPQLRLGYAYGYTISEINGYSTGSHELMIGYDFRFKKDGIFSPRLF